MVRAFDTGRRPAEPAIDVLRRIREDALPENLDYRDRGCELASRCLSCPLPRCKYDRPGGGRRLLLEARDRKIVALWQRRRLPAGLLAQRFGISRRSVFRILQAARRESDGAA